MDVPSAIRLGGQLASLSRGRKWLQGRKGGKGFLISVFYTRITQTLFATVHLT